MKKNWIIPLILSLFTAASFFLPQASKPALAQSFSPEKPRGDIIRPVLDDAPSCPQALDGLPPSSDTSGALLLLQGSDTSQFFRDTLYDFRRGLFLTSPISSSNVRWEPDNVAFSPNKQWAAFITYTLDAPGLRQTSRVLHVRNALGYALDLSSWQVDWQYIIGWVNNQEIALATPGLALGDVTVLNPFTGKHRVVRTPEISMKLAPQERNAQTLYSPDLTSFILPVNSCDCAGKDNNTWMAFEANGQASHWLGVRQNNNEPIWSPDGRSVAVITNVQDTGDNGLTGQILLTDPAGYGSAITDTLRFPGYDLGNLLAWSPDSRYIAFWYVPDTEDSVWQASKRLGVVDTQRWGLVDLCVSSQTILGDTPAVWSPDQQYLAVASNDDYSTDTKVVDLVNAKTYTIGDAIPYGWMSNPGNAQPTTADLSQDSSLLVQNIGKPVTAVEQALGGNVQVPKATRAVDLESAPEVTNLAEWTLEGGQMVSSLAFSADNRYLAAGYQNGMVALIDRQSGVVDRRMIARGEFGVCSVRFVNGEYALVAGLYDGRVIKLRADRAKPEWETSLPSGICDLSVSGDGKTILAGQKIGGQSKIYLLSASDGGTLATVDGFGAGFIPGQNQFILSTGSMEIELWRLDPLKKEAVLGQVNDTREGIVISPDGSLVLAVPTSFRQPVSTQEFRVSDRTYLNDLTYTHNTNMAAFSPDSHMVVLGVSGDNSFYLYNSFSAEQLARLSGHSLPVTAVAFSPDGQWLASGSDDSKIVIWGIQ